MLAFELGCLRSSAIDGPLTRVLFGKRQCKLPRKRFKDQNANCLALIRDVREEEGKSGYQNGLLERYTVDMTLRDDGETGIEL